MTLEQRDSMVAIQVIDDGPGVPKGEADSIFLPYRRSASSTRVAESVGLGLSVSRHIARAMGGDLEYRRGKGRTIFELTLPRFVPEAKTAAVASVEVGDRKSIRPPSWPAFSVLPGPAWTERFGGAVPEGA